MKIFEYKARSLAGELNEGELAADSVEEVEKYLFSNELVPIKVGRARHETSLSARLKQHFSSNLIELVIFTRQLSSLYHAGIPIVKSLQIISTQSTSRLITKATCSIKDRIEKGSTLSDAFASQSRLFSSTYVAAIKAGEQSGGLDKVLDQLAMFLEREAKTRSDIKAAVLYPIIVICAVILAFFGMVTFVIPKFVTFYGKFDAALPLPTRILLEANHLITNYYHIVIPVLIIAVVAIFKLLKTRGGKRVKDRFLLWLPVFGPLFVKVSTSRFAHICKVLYESGLPIVECLEISKETVGYYQAVDELEEIKEKLRAGDPLFSGELIPKFFPTMALQMFQIGMESGALERMLAEVARHFDREIDYTTKKLTALIEPILIVLLGAMILLLALAIFMPMWNMLSVLKPG